MIVNILPLSDAELFQLLADLESDRVERKADWTGDAAKKVRQAVCAFANNLPGHTGPGVVLIGVRDDGTLSNAPIGDKLLLTLASLKSDGKILPPPTLTVEKRGVAGGDIALVTVWPADAPPVRFDGKIWIRTGPRRDIASLQDERVLNERRQFRDQPYDSRGVESCSLSELNRSVFEQDYLPQAIDSEVLAANERTYEERLASTGMVVSATRPVPTVCGILTLGKSPRDWIPGAYVSFLRIRGTQWGGPVVDAQDIDGTVDLIFRRLDDKIKATLAVAVDFTSGSSVEERNQPYPLSALQQIARNAILHRAYENTNTPVRFYWFDDRIEIHSPGGPFGNVTVENFGQPGVTDYRNPRLASVLKNLGFVQSFGFGIAEARRSLDKNGNPPPRFEVTSTFVMVVIQAAT